MKTKKQKKQKRPRKLLLTTQTNMKIKKAARKLQVLTHMQLMTVSNKKLQRFLHTEFWPLIVAKMKAS